MGEQPEHNNVGGELKDNKYNMEQSQNKQLSMKERMGALRAQMGEKEWKRLDKVFDNGVNKAIEVLKEMSGKEEFIIPLKDSFEDRIKAKLAERKV